MQRKSGAQRARERMIDRAQTGAHRPTLAYRRDTADLSPAEAREVERMIADLHRAWDRGESGDDIIAMLEEAGVDVDAINRDHFDRVKERDDEEFEERAAKLRDDVAADLRRRGYTISETPNGLMKAAGRADSNSSKRVTRHGGTPDRRFDGMADPGGELTRRTGGATKQTGASEARQRMIERGEVKK